MAHRATVYSVRVHERYKPKEPREFGDFDEAGRYLAEFLESVFDPGTFSALSADGNKEVMCEKRQLDEPELRAVLLPGERGLRADIMDNTGQLQFEQTPEHTQILRCGSLFRLPRDKSHGWWAVHLNHNRGVKSLVENVIQERFKKDFPDLILTINPAVNSAAYEAALEKDNLLSAKLVKYERPSDISAGDKWVRSDTGLKMELTIQPERGKRLIPTLVKKAFRGDAQAFGDVVEFGGLTFDAAKLEVELENGTRRTFNVQNPDSGHPFSEDIEPDLENDGSPKEDSLFAELRKVLAEMG